MLAQPVEQPTKIRIHRLPKNPIDVTTIVSVLPKPILENRPMMQPPTFLIPAAPEGEFSILVVNSGVWLKEIELDNFQEMYIPSAILAKSIIEDSTFSMLGASPTIGPGVFMIPGKFTIGELRKDPVIVLDPDHPETARKFSTYLKDAYERQRRWYNEIITQTDSLWARSNGNPLVVSDDARLAAKELKVSRDWMQNFSAIEKEACKACGNLVNPSYPVCPNCKTIINEAKAKELGLKFVS